MINITLRAGALQAVLKRAGIMPADITDVNLELKDGHMSFHAMSFGRDRHVSGIVPTPGEGILPIGSIENILNIVGGKSQNSKKGFSAGTMIHITNSTNRLIFRDCEGIKRYETPFTADNVILSRSTLAVKREGDELFAWSEKQKKWAPMGTIGGSFRIVSKSDFQNLLKEGAFQKELRLTMMADQVTINSRAEDTTGFDKIGVEIIKFPEKESVGATFTSLGELFIPLLSIAKDSELTCFLIEEMLLYVEEVCEDGSKYTYILMGRSS